VREEGGKDAGNIATMLLINSDGGFEISGVFGITFQSLLAWPSRPAWGLSAVDRYLSALSTISGIFGTRHLDHEAPC
jgi:hypothetical protein